MKQIVLAILTCTILLSCTNNNDDTINAEQNIPLEGTYSYFDTNCGIDDSKTTAECTDYVEFLKDFKVSVILRKDDLPYETEYTYTNETLALKKVPVSDSKLSFTIKNDTTLIRLEDNTLWRKE